MTAPAHSPRPDRPKIRVFLEGRYRKLVRDLPQTIFYCPECKGRGGGCAHCEGFGKLTRDSVQEIVARKVLPRYKARRGKFHGAGREDLDVRMLGPGRPFVFEVVHPKNLVVDVEEMVRAVNDYGRGRIEITELVPVPRRRVSEIKETQSPKVYRALVAVAAPVPTERLAELPGREVAVVQRTPQRVAHRRADKDRARTVEILSLVAVRGPAAEDCIELSVRCQHGTYVKEWISGEEGRSRPSFADLLGCGTHCLALDVWDVSGPFPPLDDRPAPRFPDEMTWPLPGPLSDDPWGLVVQPSAAARRAED